MFKDSVRPLREAYDLVRARGLIAIGLGISLLAVGLIGPQRRAYTLWIAEMCIPAGTLLVLGVSKALTDHMHGRALVAYDRCREAAAAAAVTSDEIEARLPPHVRKYGGGHVNNMPLSMRFETVAVASTAMLAVIYVFSLWLGAGAGTLWAMKHALFFCWQAAGIASVGVEWHLLAMLRYDISEYERGTAALAQYYHLEDVPVAYATVV